MVQFSIVSLSFIICITFTFCAPLDGANNAAVTGLKLQNRQNYKICSVANGLCMTAEERTYDEELSEVFLEKFDGLTDQKWMHVVGPRQASAFVSGENRYNNVTLYHEKNSFHVYKDFSVTKIKDDNVFVLQHVQNSKIRQNNLCLQSMGENNAVQLLPCNPESVDQQWKFEEI